MPLIGLQVFARGRVAFEHTQLGRYWAEDEMKKTAMSRVWAVARDHRGQAMAILEPETKASMSVN
jgi:hypothetical protein